jgi:uncharacterized protein (DUF2147 family)
MKLGKTIKMKRLLTIVVAACALHSFAAIAQTAAPAVSPVGLWKTIDDETGKPKSILRISESNGEYKAKIEKLFRQPSEDQNPKCDKCEDARKDQPIIGMTIMTGMKLQEGLDYAGGQILDPHNGKIYKAKMSLDEDGKKLNLRGYIGLPILGRTQVWMREP